MIAITGAAGFIASYLVGSLRSQGIHNILLIDDFSQEKKKGNWEPHSDLQRIHRDDFPNFLLENPDKISFLFHLGARTDTTEFNINIFNTLNVNYSIKLWDACAKNRIPMVYASSAATYGAGDQGYTDDEKSIPMLKPLNPYGDSKQQFDIYALSSLSKPPFWAGLKFFNVYGPNEYHKGRMASVVMHAFNQIQNSSSMKLFRSHKAEYADGEQQRDFVYVKDVARVCQFLLKQSAPSGIYNLGSGKARTFLDLVKSVFRSMNLPEQISFIDTPEDIRESYQYFTEASMHKLKVAGYTQPFTSLEDGVREYVQEFLLPMHYYTGR